MNTPAHLLIGTAAFGRPAVKGTRAAAVFGALVPDLSLYLLAGFAMYVQAIPPGVVFNELYFSEAWQSIFRIDNSLFLWALALAIGLWARRPLVVAFAASGLLHVGSDFLLHNDDARAHLWPLTDWRFISPISYWDSTHGARVVAPILAVLAVAAGAFMIWRDRAWGWGVLWGALILAELNTLKNWLLYF